MANRIVINRVDDGPISIELNGKIVYALGEPCKNCENIREKFRLAIDKQNILQDERHRMARLLGYNPNAPETWPLDLIDRLINFEKAEGWDRLFHKINQMNGVKGY